MPSLPVVDRDPPEFLQVVAHPLRWRLVGELARSDRSVRELMGRLGEPQSLVSYHLGKLRDAELVSTRRSSADRRDAYYAVDLTRLGTLLADAGGAVHPGLRLVPPPAGAGPDGTRVLFLCTGNSARSQMAEALVRVRAHGRVEARSAGSHPKPLHPNAVRVMRERGIDIADRRSKHISELTGRRFDYVISLCDRVREVCPELPGRPETVHWSLPDPSAGPAGADDEASYPAFARTAAELETRIGFLLAGLSATATAS